LQVKLAVVYLESGSPHAAADTLQCLLQSLFERPEGSPNTAKKISVLAWLAQAYLEMDDTATCEHVLKLIAEIRVEVVKQHELRRGPTWGPTLGNLAESIETTPRTTFRWRNSRVNLSFADTPQNSNPLLQSYSSTIPPVPSSHSLRPTDAFESNLPRFSSYVDNADLGELKAKVLFKRGFYAAALTQVTQTIISVELNLMQSRQSAPRECLLELGRLYSLKGKERALRHSLFADHPPHTMTSTALDVL